MAAFDFRPRSNTELLDASVEFTRSHFGILAATLALAQIPLLAVTFTFPPSPTDPFARLREQPGLAIAIILFSLWVQAVLAVTFVHVVDDLLHGRQASLTTALSRAIVRSGGAVLMLISAYVVMILWALLFFFPVIWAYARYFAIVPAFAVESLSASGAIRRSKELAKKNNGRAIALGLVPALVAGVIMVIVQQGLLGAGVAFLTTRVVGAIMTIVLYPFSMVPAIFLYYDLRTRREGLDLDFGTLTHPTPTAAA
jgi:hypothetical protein